METICATLLRSLPPAVLPAGASEGEDAASTKKLFSELKLMTSDKPLMRHSFGTRTLMPDPFEAKPASFDEKCRAGSFSFSLVLLLLSI